MVVLGVLHCERRHLAYWSLLEVETVNTLGEHFRH